MAQGKSGEVFLPPLTRNPAGGAHGYRSRFHLRGGTYQRTDLSAN